MTHQELLTKYLEQLEKVGTKSTDRMHFMSYLFIGLSVVFYFLATSATCQFQLFGATLTVPRIVILVVAPVILSVILYFFSSFACLEHQAYMEVRRVVLELCGNELPLTPWQLLFFEAPSYYTYSEIRNYSDTQLVFRWAGYVTLALISIMYFLVFPLVIGYFIYLGIQSIKSSWLALPYGVSAFLTVFATLQHSETLRPKK
jgi:hypothetical protein